MATKSAGTSIKMLQDNKHFIINTKLDSLGKCISNYEQDRKVREEIEHQAEQILRNVTFMIDNTEYKLVNVNIDSYFTTEPFTSKFSHSESPDRVKKRQELSLLFDQYICDMMLNGINDEIRDKFKTVFGIESI